MTWYCHVDDSTKGRYDIILGRYLLTLLGLNIKSSEQVIEVDYGPLKGLTAAVVDLGGYQFIYLNMGKITPE